MLLLLNAGGPLLDALSHRLQRGRRRAMSVFSLGFDVCFVLLALGSLLWTVVCVALLCRVDKLSHTQLDMLHQAQRRWWGWSCVRMQSRTRS